MQKILSKLVLVGMTLILVAFVLPCFMPGLLTPKAHAQMYSDNGVSNFPGGGWVMGRSITPYTNSAGTTVWLTAKSQPLGFFGSHSTNRQTVAAVTNVQVAGDTAATTNLVNQFNALLAALRAYGLIVTN